MANPFNQFGTNGERVDFEFTPSEIDAGGTGNFLYSVEIPDADPNRNLQAEVKAFLYVNGVVDSTIVASEVTETEENETVEGTLSHTFQTNSSRNEAIDEGQREEALNQGTETREKYNSYPRTDEPIWIKVEIDYYDPNASGYRRGNVDEVASTVDESVSVTNPFDAPEPADTSPPVEIGGNDTLSGTFEGRTPFSVKDIEYEDDATYLESIYTQEQINSNNYSISFDYSNPTVAIDTAGRFVKHDIIGGTVVRQKIGEDPINISINGVCKRETANRIDSLRDAKSGKIFSDRLPGDNDALRVQFGSTSTSPMEDGGSADITDGRYLYTFQINAIEVIR